MLKLHSVLVLFHLFYSCLSLALALPQNSHAPYLLEESSSDQAVLPKQSSSNSGAGFLRGINLGGWLLVEPWMLPKNSPLSAGQFSQAKDEITLAAVPGAKEAFRQHRNTAVTEADIQTIASYGINALRIPIGYWAFDQTATPYQYGAVDYLEKAINWAKAANMKVWIDCHGSPGSQNGQQTSGNGNGVVNWQHPENYEKSLQILEIMAAKYGTAELANTVIGIEVVNEPLQGSNDFGTTQQFARDAYGRIKQKATNPNLMVITHDGFYKASPWSKIASGIGGNDFGIDVHQYQLYDDADNALNLQGHIQKVCNEWVSDLSPNQNFPVYVGEFSALINICVNPDGSTTNGTTCTQEGCQCPTASNTPIEQWKGYTRKAIGEFFEAQLDVWTEHSSGYFFWSWGAGGGWGLKPLIENGVVARKVTERKWPRQCKGGAVDAPVASSAGSDSKPSVLATTSLASISPATASPATMAPAAMAPLLTVTTAIAPAVTMTRS